MTGAALVVALTIAFLAGVFIGGLVIALCRMSARSDR